MNIARRIHLPRLLMAVLLFLLVAACSQEPTADEHVERARDHQAEGEYRAAIIELRNALQAQSDHAVARLLLGRVYVEVEQMASAEKELRRARELGVPLEELAVPLGIALLDRGKPEVLLEDIEPDESWPASTRASVHGLRARAHIANGDATAAREALDRADAATDGNLHADIARIDLALARNRTGEAVSHADIATGNHPESPAAWRATARAATAENDAEKAEAALSRAIELAVQPGEDRLRRARLRVNRGDIEGAREDLAALGDGRQGNPRVRFVKALADWAEGDFDSACDRMQQVVSDTREFVEARFYHGVCLYRSGELNQAEAHLNWVNQRTSEPRVALLLAVLRLELDETELARQTVKPVLQQNPDNTRALALLSRIELESGNTAEASGHLQRLAELRPEDPAAQFELGRTLVSTGQLDAGQEALDEALELNPKDERAGAAAVITHIQAGEHERALQAARKMAEQQPDAPLPWTLEGVVQIRQGDREAARGALEKAIERSPADPAARHLLARLARDDGDLDRAQSHYEAVLEEHPEHTETLLLLARLAAEAGDTGRVGTLLRRAHEVEPEALRPRVLLGRYHLARGDAAAALDVIEGSDGDVPRNAEALVLAGEAALAAGRTERAIGYFESVKAMRPEQSAPYLLLARAYTRAGRGEAARAELHRTLEVDPDNASALMILARASVREGDAGEARALLERLPEEYNDHAFALDTKARVALAEGDTAGAIEFYRRALDVAPASGIVVRLARAQRLAEREDEALATLRGWLEEHPDDAEVWLAAADLQRAQGDEKAAIAAYRSVLSVNAGSVLALNNLAWLLRERAPEEALEYAEQAAELAPENPAVRDTYGMVLLARGRTDEAIEQLRQAVEAAPRAPSLRHNLARALTEAGRDGEAIEQLRRLLEGSGEFDGRAEAEALLRELEG